MTATLTIEELLDRQAVVDCLYRYARGVDRLDDELVHSAFHSDGVHHAGGKRRSVSEFLAWYRGKPREASAQHYVTNDTVQLDGDLAHSESYFLATSRRDDGRLRMSGGRYLDRLERRDGAWRIAVRFVIGEWAQVADVTEVERTAKHDPRAMRDRSDRSYDRPLLPLEA
jgi:ketosteroid isomerase-like protein